MVFAPKTKKLLHSCDHAKRENGTMYLNTLFIVQIRTSMSNSRIGKRLKRLTELGICSCTTAEQYTEELKELTNKNVSLENADRKSRIFKALADSTRLRILGLLTVREMCVCEIMVALSLTQPTASHHLKILENAGLVRDRKEGKWVFYSLPDRNLVMSLLQFDVR
jgi:ArsR family transcriptional regulator